MKRKRSNVWNFFESVDNESRLAKCNLCKLKFSYKTSTSNLKKHIKNKHAIVPHKPEERVTVSLFRNILFILFSICNTDMLIENNFLYCILGKK